MNKLALVALVVDDYDRAIDFYVNRLGFQLTEDTVLSPEKRWVVVTPNSHGASLLLAKASTDEQRAHIGNQTGGRVFLFLHTDTFDVDYQRFVDAGVQMTEDVRHEPYGRVVVFVDLYGNKWDLIEVPTIT
jgi:catechol 2,3-dioxygenase-like lactoylglutathione lyase family enzyme